MLNAYFSLSLVLPLQRCLLFMVRRLTDEPPGAKVRLSLAIKRGVSELHDPTLANAAAIF